MTRRQMRRLEQAEQCAALFAAAEIYHRARIAPLRKEQDRMCNELRRHGIDPATVLLEARQPPAVRPMQCN